MKTKHPNINWATMRELKALYEDASARLSYCEKENLKIRNINAVLLDALKENQYGLSIEGQLVCGDCGAFEDSKHRSDCTIGKAILKAEEN